MKHTRLYYAATFSLLAASITACGSNDTLMAQEPENAENLAAMADSDASAPTETENSGFTGASSTDGYEIIFEDDFVNDTGIPDPDKWSLCKKGDAHWAQYQSESYDLAYTKDGLLNLVVEQKDGQYLTSGIETMKKFSFTYGKVEVRARFTKRVMGSHCGIWMMPEPPAETWPKSGEIDIMEYLRNQDFVHLTTHSYWLNDMGHSEDGVSYTTASVDKDDWNIYGVEWTADAIRYTVNGKVVLTYSRDQNLSGEDAAYQWPFTHPFYLILSHSLGGDGTWAGPIDNSQLPGLFQIDWVRVMQPAAPDAGVPRIPAD